VKVLKEKYVWNHFCSLLILLIIVSTNEILADDWPQWRGNNRNGISKETGLLKSWPEGGPKLLWSNEDIGEGFSSMSIADGSLYITGLVDKQETLFAFDLDGKLKWKTAYGPNWKGSFPVARTTATVDGSNLYVISGMGNAACIDANSGKIKWSVQTVEKFNGEYHSWGIAESPLVVDDKVIFTPGGINASMVALNKKTGETVWQTKTLSEQHNYCSPILIQRGGKKIIASQLQDSFVGVDAKTGKVLWQDNYTNFLEDPKDINIVTPIYYEGHIYVTSGYDDGGAMYELAEDGTGIKRLWEDKVLDVHHGGVVLIDGFIYGSNWENNRNGNWVCLDWKTGKVMYEKKWFNKGSIISAEGMLYCYEEKDGNFALVKASPNSFDIISSFKIEKGSGQHWAHPAISDGRLYLRHGEALMVYDIRSKQL
jgi:outer membrane protein assembly factor BamB